MVNNSIPNTKGDKEKGYLHALGDRHRKRWKTTNCVQYCSLNTNIQDCFMLHLVCGLLPA